jgi:hypothetical protein
MSNARDDFFSLFGRIVGQNILESDDPKKTGDLKVPLAVIGVLAFVGNEAVKVLFRRNFTFSPLGWIRMVICVLCFGGISAISFVCVNSKESFALKSASPDAHLASGVFFAILAITVLIKGLKHADKHSLYEYSGDSVLLSFLKKDNWKEPYIQNFAEPFLVLAIGISFTFFDYFAGTTIIFCALSVWANALFDMFFKASSMEEDTDRLNRRGQRAKFNKVNT